MLKDSGRMFLALVLAIGMGRSVEGADHGKPEDMLNRSSVEAAKATKDTIGIRLSVNGRSVTASLNDNASARELLTLLPMTLTLEDYAATEKINYLSKKLTIGGAPAGFSPVAGDIAYYAPWGNLAFFYKNAAYAKGLVKLGRIDSGAEVLNAPGALTMKIERMPP